MKKPIKKPTAYGVYIVESLRSEDFADGDVLHQILELSNITAVYEFADTVDDFKRLIQDFKTSQFRYLHLSCHANRLGIEINGEGISNKDLNDLLKGGLLNKRVFMSACKGANRDLGKKLILSCGANSLIGTPVDLYFDKAVLFWPSFYHIINELDQKRMKRIHLIKSLQQCVDLFNIPINYYSKIKKDKTAIRRLKIRSGKPAVDNRLTPKFN
jgi:hypothetical protein